MQTVPILPTANQVVSVTLAGQPCQLQIAQKSTGLFITVSVNNAPIISGVICQDRNRVVRDVYLGFAGDLAFVDTQGAADPYYTGLGSRWQLRYYSVADLTALGLVG
jgi:hypothetical protein